MMFSEVNFYMQDSNALVAYAYIKSNKNPYQTLCNYICYCIQKIGGDRIVPDQIQIEVQQEFGIVLSPLLLQACIRILRNEKRISISRATTAITLNHLGFDQSRFERDRAHLKDLETRVINHLIEYTTALGVEHKWSESEARSYLGDFLLNNNNGLNLAFSTEEIELPQSKYITPGWYVGRFVAELQRDKTCSEYEYLKSISNGLMIYVGVTETTNNVQSITQKFKGTDFYLDTKIMLRAMGYSLPFYIQTTDELLKLIRNANKAMVCIFEHTLGEILSALSTAENELRQGREIRDAELSLFANYFGCDADDFHMYYSTARQRIEDVMGIRIQPSCDWNNSEVQVNNLDWDGLEKKIAADHPGWKPIAIRNDVCAINTINILRKGKYHTRFGGNERLPIFVTTNTALISSIRDFVSQDEPDQTTADWSKDRLPIISDTVLLCRLWLPQAKHNTDLPAITLAANAYAAQQGDQCFYSQLRAAYAKAALIHKDTVLDLDEFRARKLEEIIVSASHGDLEKIDGELVAKSLDELLIAETLRDKQSIADLDAKYQEATRSKQVEDELWLSGFCQRFLQKRFCRISRFFAKAVKKHLPYIFAVTFVIVAELINLLTEPLLANGGWRYLVPLVIAVSFVILETKVERIDFLEKIRKLVLEKCKTHYIDSIEKQIPESLSAKKDAVLHYCSHSTDEFDK